MKKTIIQTLTLIFFVGMMGTFVAYRAGVFGEADGSVQLDPNGSVINANKKSAKVDTPRKKIPKVIISSSKSIRRVFNPKKTKADTPKKNKNVKLIPSSKSGRVFKPKKEVKPKILPGSKSGRIFKPKKGIKPKVLPGSKSGVIFKPKKSNKPKVLPGSKSGVIFKPKPKKDSANSKKDQKQKTKKK